MEALQGFCAPSITHYETSLVRCMFHAAGMKGHVPAKTAFRVAWFSWNNLGGHIGSVVALRIGACGKRPFRNRANAWRRTRTLRASPVRQPDEEACALDRSTEWYFAIGSMINPHSLAARGLFPKESHPAELLDHRIVFRGSQGMAGADPDPGESFHGVLHLMDCEEMAKLDQMEMGYDRSPSTARLYNGELLACTAYVMNPEKIKAMMKRASVSAPSEDNLPQQRYIEIILEGCAHYGVAEEYMAKLRAQPCRPRKQPNEFVSLEVPPDTPTWTVEDVRAGDGKDGRPLYRTMGNKVLEYTGPREGPMWEMMMRQHGSDSLVNAARMLYDPLYGVPETLEDMSDEHKRYREDMLVSMIKVGGKESVQKLVAIMKD